MSNGNATPSRSAPDEFEASLQNIMERLRRQAEEIAQLRRDLDKVRSSTSIVTPATGVDVPGSDPAPSGSDDPSA